MIEEKEQIEEVKELPEADEQKRSFKRGIRAGIAVGVAIVLVLMLIITVAVRNHYMVSFINKKAADSQDVLDAESESKIKELLGQIDLYYYKDTDKADLTDGLYKGLFEGLGDSYSVYYTKEEYESMMASTSGTYFGIGAVLSQDVKTMQVSILHVYENTPAEKAGLKDGDVIVKVEDINAAEMELSELVTHIRGDKGTTVHMQIAREGEADYLELDIERDKVEVPTVTSEMLDNHIGYIAITEFAEPTEEQFMQAVNSLKDQGMESVIISTF